MPRFKLTIEYAGTRYSGWQIQKNARTVAGELERAIAEVTGVRSFELYGAGRTDAGVHALAQVAHLQIDTRIDAATLAWRVNDELAGRHQHPRAGARAPAFPRPARRGGAQLSLPGRPAAHGVRQAVRLVGARRPRT